MVGQLDSTEGFCRVTEVRGARDYLKRGMNLPLAKATADLNAESEGNGNSGVPSEVDLDGEFLSSLSVKALLARPLELSDGSIVGTLCALDTEADPYRPGHLAMLEVAARLLSYEWENVTRRAELQRLRERVRDTQSSDADTGLPNRESFLGVLEREWRLTARGSVQSVLVACHVSVDGADRGLRETMRTLALKDTAEVLSGATRSTDHVGRTGEMDLAAILVGCHGLEGAEAFVRRFRAGVKRVTGGLAVPISASCSTVALAGSPSADNVLEQAERVARDTSVADNGRHGAPPEPTHDRH